MKPINQWTPNDAIDFIKTVDKKTWIKVGVIGGSVVLIFFLIIWPAWFKRIYVHNRITIEQAKISALEALERKKPEWLRNREDYSKFIQEVKSKLYTAGGTSFLLGEISKLAKDSNVVIISSRPQDSTEKFPAPFDQQYEASFYNFTVEGNYHALGTFVSRIESYPKLLRIQSFHLTPRDETPNTHVADIQISAFSIKKGAN